MKEQPLSNMIFSTLRKSSKNNSRGIDSVIDFLFDQVCDYSHPLKIAENNRHISKYVSIRTYILASVVFTKSEYFSVNIAIDLT